ncbi:MAG: hypothetical protein PHR35_10940 [Kiritimatiellae bacterium]|nr:hypothetical protein [Kiritimatiellia bacterium]
MGKVRDRFWLWGHEAGSHNGMWHLPRPSRMTPAEAAYYMGIPNVVMVRFRNLPKPPFDQYALSLAPLKRVTWSIVGDSSTVDNNAGGSDLEEVLRLSRKCPNIQAAIMDDFFHRPSDCLTPTEDPYSRYTVAELHDFRRRLHAAPRPLDLWVVLYEHQLDLPLSAHLAACDVVNFWTWSARNLPDLEANLRRVEALAPAQRKILGCYMWDYGPGAPMPVEMMEHQCRVGLEWLASGRIDGLVFLASCICDMEIETVEWTRQWIARVGDQPLAIEGTCK